WRTTSSKNVLSRGVTRSSGCRAFAGAAASPFSAFGAFAAFGAFSALSGLGARSAFSGFLDSALSFLSAIDLDSRTLRDAHLTAVRQDAESDPRRLAILGVGQRQIGEVHRRLLADDPAVLGRGLLLMALDQIDAAHQRAVLARAHLDHLAFAALVAAGAHDDGVAFLDLGGHHSTSGASEMIFM